MNLGYNNIEPYHIRKNLRVFSNLSTEIFTANMEISFPISGFELVVPSGEGRFTKLEFVSDNCSMNCPETGYEIVISIESAHATNHDFSQPMSSTNPSYLPTDPIMNPSVPSSPHPSNVVSSVKPSSDRVSNDKKKKPQTSLNKNKNNVTTSTTKSGQNSVTADSNNQYNVEELNRSGSADKRDVCFAPHHTVWKSNSIYSSQQGISSTAIAANMQTSATEDPSIVDVFGKDLVYEPSRKNNRAQHNQFLNSNYTKSVREWKMRQEGSKEVLMGGSAELNEGDEISDDEAGSEGGDDMPDVLVEAAKSVGSDDSTNLHSKMGTQRSRIDKAQTAVQFLHGNYMQSRKELLKKGSSVDDDEGGDNNSTDDSDHLLTQNREDSDESFDLDSEGGFDLAEERVAAIHRAVSTRLEIPPLSDDDDDDHGEFVSSVPSSPRPSESHDTNRSQEMPTCQDSGLRRPKPRRSTSTGGKQLSFTGAGETSNQYSRNMSQENHSFHHAVNKSVSIPPHTQSRDSGSSSGVKRFLPSVGSLLIERD